MFNIENLSDSSDKTDKNLNDPNIPVVSGADLTLIHVSYPNKISAEENFVISFNIKNNGDENLNSGFNVNLYLVSNNAGVSESEYYIQQLVYDTNNIAAGATFLPGSLSSHTLMISASMMTSIGILDRKHYQIRLKIIANSLQEEPNENQTNNNYTSIDTAQIINKANLSISSITKLTGTSIYTDAYSVVVENYGPGGLQDMGVTDFKVKLFLTVTSDPTSALISGTSYVYCYYNGVLPPFDSATLDPITLEHFGFNNMSNIWAGSAYLQAIVNFDDKQPETDKTDNLLLSPIFIN